MPLTLSPNLLIRWAETVQFYTQKLLSTTEVQPIKRPSCRREKVVRST